MILKFTKAEVALESSLQEFFTFLPASPFSPPSVARVLPGESGMVTALRQILGSEPRETNNHWHVLARDHLGEVGYRQLFADLEAEGHGKVAEPATPYDASTGRMTQRRLFD